MPDLSPWHLLILAAVFVVLFGSRKLPDAARSLGKSMRIFKAETSALRRSDEDSDEPRPTSGQQQPVLQQQAQQAPVTVTLEDGTVVSGVPLAEPQRNQQST